MPCPAVFMSLAVISLVWFTTEHTNSFNGRTGGRQESRWQYEKDGNEQSGSGSETGLL